MTWEKDLSKIDKGALSANGIMKQLYFVYGTLRKGQYNHNNFLNNNNSCFKGNTKLECVKMYSLGGYPCIVETDNSKDIVVGELYECDENDSRIQSMVRMELGAGYKKKQIETKLGKANVFVFDKEPKYYKEIIQSGNWLK